MGLRLAHTSVDIFMCASSVHPDTSLPTHPSPRSYHSYCTVDLELDTHMQKASLQTSLYAVPSTHLFPLLPPSRDPSRRANV